jgi:hypothetical protein
VHPPPSSAGSATDWIIERGRDADLPALRPLLAAAATAEFDSVCPDSAACLAEPLRSTD